MEEHGSENRDHRVGSDALSSLGLARNVPLLVALRSKMENGPSPSLSTVVICAGHRKRERSRSPSKS
jgi:hypothetical protein